MKELVKAIISKFTAAPGGIHNDLYNAVQGRMYDGETEKATYPYIVFLLPISDDPESESTFTEETEDILMQFSIYSKNFSRVEIDNIFSYLKTLFDRCTLDITGYDLVWMRRQSATLMNENYITTDGTTRIRHYAVDYLILLEVK